MLRDPYKYFRVEGHELIDQLSQGALDLEKGPPAPDAVARLLRLAHTLKGAAGVVRQLEIGERAHALEARSRSFATCRVPCAIASTSCSPCSTRWGLDGAADATSGRRTPSQQVAPPMLASTGRRRSRPRSRWRGRGPHSTGRCGQTGANALITSSTSWWTSLPGHGSANPHGRHTPREGPIDGGGSARRGARWSGSWHGIDPSTASSTGRGLPNAPARPAARSRFWSGPSATWQDPRQAGRLRADGGEVRSYMRST